MDMFVEGDDEEMNDYQRASGDQMNPDEEGEDWPEQGRGDDDDDDDDEEEDEEDEEDQSTGRKHKRSKYRHTKSNPFIDDIAVVSDDDEPDDDEEEFPGRDGFIIDPIDDAEDGDFDRRRRAADHQRLDRQRQELSDQDLARMANEVKQRYVRSAARYHSDMDQVPQRLLMPSVNDASLWQVRVKPGREREIIFSLMRKAIDLEYSTRPLEILSAFERSSLPGIIYIEARSNVQVSQAIQGLVSIFPSRGITLVPIDEMASLLQIRKKETTITPGSWVRIKRGKYQGDLAQVVDVTENGEEVGLKFIPRIDLNPRDDGAAGAGSEQRKRKKTGGAATSTTRPPLRFFNAEEVIKVHGRKAVAHKGQVYVFLGDTYKDGFIEKDMRITGLITENVNPTLAEVTRFASHKEGDGAESSHNIDLSIIADAARKAAIVVLQPGDHVEVFEGEQTGLHGVVESILGDVVTMRAIGIEIEGQKVEVPARSVRKRFKAGDHIKVMAGQNADETGLVVSVTDNVVTFLSDMSDLEVSVFSKDVREAAEVGAGTNAVGQYELHDLVHLDAQTVGVIFKTERDSFRVLDQHGQVRQVQPHQIHKIGDTRRTIATDSEGNELQVGDNVKEIDGEIRRGQVLKIHQSFFAFLHNRDLPQNGGVFVTRARSLAPVAPKGTAARPGAPDLSKMNPALNGAASGGMVGSTMGRGPRDRLIGVSVIIIKGPQKGYIGAIKDTNGIHARVELNSSNKVITIEKDKLRRRNPNGTMEPLEGEFKSSASSGSWTPQSSMGPPGGWGGRTPNPYAQDGGRTPGWGASGRTPNPYADNRTPAWNQSSRTPNPYAEGGKTPAWNSMSQTPNPYANDGGRTPSAWGAGTRTPNPYADKAGGGGGGGGSGGGWGGATPARPGYGGATPSRPTGGSTWGNTTPGHTGSYGGATPARPTGGSSWGGETPRRTDGGGWGSNTSDDSGPHHRINTPAYSGAATPFSAPTPGVANAPTPGPSSAPTPGASYTAPYNTAATPAGVFSAPTPAVFSAPTPGGFSAPTPGAGYSFSSAPTPGGIRSAPTPGGGLYNAGDDMDEDRREQFVLSSRWLQDFKEPGTQVRIKGSPDWHGAQYEGLRARVLVVSDNPGTLISTAMVRLLEGDLSELSVPIEYLVPVHPENREDAHKKVRVLFGPHKGRSMELMSVQGSGWLVSFDDGQAAPRKGEYLEYEKTHLVRWDDR